MTGLKTSFEIIAIMARMVDGLEIHEDRLREGMRNEIFATDKVFDKVMAGGNFRDSYRNVGLNLEDVEKIDVDAALRKRTSLGAPGNLRLEDDLKRADELKAVFSQKLERLSAVYENLIPSVNSVLSC